MAVKSFPHSFMCCCWPCSDSPKEAAAAQGVRLDEGNPALWFRDDLDAIRKWKSGNSFPTIEIGTHSNKDNDFSSRAQMIVCSATL
jgi:hypothetical protein